MTGFARLGVAPEKAVFRPALPLRSLPGLYGAGMTKMSYAEQLLHPKWQRLRLGVFDAAGWACSRCGDTENTLHAHHPEYRRGAMAWEYEVSELKCLCSYCHTTEHGKGRPPAGSISSKRDAWELLADFNIMACSEAADHPEREHNAARSEARARELCAAAGYDYDALMRSCFG